MPRVHPRTAKLLLILAPFAAVPASLRRMFASAVALGALACSTILTSPTPSLGAEPAPVLPVASPRGSHSDAIEIGEPFLEPGEGTLLLRPRASRPETAGRGGSGEIGLRGTEESTVRINPTNPDNIVYASLWEVRVSNDGGATFEPAVSMQLPPGHAYLAGDPSLAFDADGRVFLTYLAGTPPDVLSIVVAQLDPHTGQFLPDYPVVVAGPDVLDKPWICADVSPTSPYQGRLYLTWKVYLVGNFGYIVMAHSTDEGRSWTSPIGFFFEDSWAPTVVTAPNGDVFWAWHNDAVCSPSIHHGEILMRRSTDGGQSFVSVTSPYPDGQAIVPSVSQICDPLPGVRVHTIGNRQPWILPDPQVPDRLSVVADHLSDVYIVHSTDAGASWTSPQRVDSGPGGTYQLFPNAGIDSQTGNIVVTWYDTRAGEVTGLGHYLFDTYAAVSTDGGLSFGADFQVNDEPLNPDLGTFYTFNGEPVPEAVVGAVSFGNSDAWIMTLSESTNRLFHWDGTNWTYGGEPPTSEFVYDLWGTDSNHLWAAASGGEIWFYDGTSWALQPTGTTLGLRTLQGRAADDVFAVGQGGTILHWDGVGWSMQASGTTETLYGIWPLPDGRVWACGSNGTVLRYDSGVWSPYDLGTTDVLHGLWGSSDTDVWCLGRNEGDLFHWDGSEWALVEAGFLPFGWEIWGNSASDVYFGGSGLLRWNGQEFETVMDPYGSDEAFAMSVHGSGAGDIVTCGFDGRVAWFDGSAWDQTIVGLPTGAVFRIGEYHGVDVAGVRAAVTWTGNTNDPVPVPQSMFERILVDSTTAGIGEIDDAVSLLLLEENTPNPFRWVTQLSYSLSAEAEVSLSIFDVAGKRVRDVERGLRTAGAYSVSWDGHDGGGNVVSPGVYFAVLEDSGGGKCVRKMTLVR